MIKGKVIAKKINQQLKNKVANLSYQPKLAIINANPNSSASFYQKMIIRHCKQVGIKHQIYLINPKDNAKQKLANLIKKLNRSKDVTGILIEKPYHIQGLAESTADDWITPSKDVDGTNSFNVSRLFHGQKSNLPCTPQAIINLLDGNHIKYSDGTKIAIINRSEIVGKPLAMYLINQGAEVTVFNHYMNKLDLKNGNYNIIIAATGKIDLITSDLVKPNQYLIPVSEVRGKDGKLHGDFTAKALQKAHGFSCRGNVGPLNLVSLMNNVLKN